MLTRDQLVDYMVWHGAYCLSARPSGGGEEGQRLRVSAMLAYPKAESQTRSQRRDIVLDVIRPLGLQYLDVECDRWEPDDGDGTNCLELVFQARVQPERPAASSVASILAEAEVISAAVRGEAGIGGFVFMTVDEFVGMLAAAGDE